VAEIVRRLEERNVGAYAVDVTSPDVEELGLKVARVVAPQLCALDVDGAAPYRGGARLYRAAFDAGLVEAPLTFDDLNPLPHPYP
jgi:ribosomal protein S12 methylthiotransferase accessory factor